MWVRFGARFLDGVFLSIIGSPLLIVIAVIAFKAGLDANGVSSAVRYTPSQSLLIGLCSLLYVILTVVYYTVFNASKLQGTLGKRVIGIKIIDEHGNRLTYGRSVTRFLASDGLGIPYSLLSNSTNGFAKGISAVFGFLYSVYLIVDASIGGSDPKKQTLHDRIAKTFVIYR
jgi:uncharacterized RDD family membrane protein YckC